MTAAAPTVDGQMVAAACASLLCALRTRLIRGQRKQRTRRGRTLRTFECSNQCSGILGTGHTCTPPVAWPGQALAARDLSAATRVPVPVRLCWLLSCMLLVAAALVEARSASLLGAPKLPKTASIRESNASTPTAMWPLPEGALCCSGAIVSNNDCIQAAQRAINSCPPGSAPRTSERTLALLQPYLGTMNTCSIYDACCGRYYEPAEWTYAVERARKARSIARDNAPTSRPSHAPPRRAAGATAATQDDGDGDEHFWKDSWDDAEDQGGWGYAPTWARYA